MNDELETYEDEVRAKYSADDLKDMVKKGQAMKNPSGDASYPIADAEDLQKAIHAVGRGNADHDSIRAHIIKRANALGLSSQIPDNWNADGSLKQSNDAGPADETRDGGCGCCGDCMELGDGCCDDCVTAEDRAAASGSVDCPTCDGSGKIRAGNVTCPDCGGDGQVTPARAAELKSRRSRRPRRATRAIERMPEWRQVSTRFERRVEQDGNDLVLVGMPVVYNNRYAVNDHIGTFREQMHPGVASAAMDRDSFDCRFLLNHDGMPLARTTSGTMTLEDTPGGLRSVAHLDSRQQAANDLAVAVERGDVSQMSVGFVVGEDEWRWADDGVEERDVYSFDELFDVSAVTFPASPTTSLELAQRMLSAAGADSRERVRRLFGVGSAARAKSPLSQKDGEDLRAAAEALAKADGAPLAVRLEMYTAVTERMGRVLREGKVLSGDNQDALEAALEALHSADDVDIPAITRSLEVIDKALDAGQAGLSEVLGKANPDGDAADAEPALKPPPNASVDADATRARQAAALAVARARVAIA